MFSNTKLIIGGILGTTVLAIIGLGYLHYTNVLAERDLLKANNIVLSTSVNVQHATIDAQTVAIEEWSEAQAALLSSMEEMASVMRGASIEWERLNDTFARHNLGELAQKRPGLIEPRLNAGSDRSIRLLECATGAGGSDCSNGD